MSAHDRLHNEIICQVSALCSDLDTRAAHPTYGVTKAMLRQRYHRLEGMLCAFSIVVQGGDCTHVETRAGAAARTLEIGLAKLLAQIELS